MYRAVANRVAVDVQALQLPISNEEVLDILTKKGFRSIDVDITQEAQKCIGNAQYVLRAKMSQAPNIVDCSSFVKYLFGKKGIWLPRISIQQRECGEVVNVQHISQGDLIFSTGKYNWFDKDPADNVGHVCIATSRETVIHASCIHKGVEEISILKYLQPNRFRGVRRIMPKNHTLLTLEIPPHVEVETADDLRWIVLSALGKSASLLPQNHLSSASLFF